MNSAYQQIESPIVLLATVHSFGVDVKSLGSGRLGFTGPFEEIPEELKLHLYYNLQPLTAYVIAMEGETR